MVSTRTRSILRTTTFRRGINYLLLRSSFHLSNLLKRPVHWGSPMAISIEPTTACNLRCPQCPSGLRQFTRETGNLKTDLNKKILDGLGPALQHINYYFQGEPFINPEFLSFVSEARRRNIYVVTSTNAHFISEQTADRIVASGLNEVIVSIDGTTQETYEKYRIEGNLEKVLTGTKNLVAAKEKANSTLPVITIQFLVVKYNEHQVPEIQKMTEEIGADRLNLKTVQVYDFENGNDLIPANEKFARYKSGPDGKLVIKNKFRNSCWRSWSGCVITWDGKVVPCCFDKDAKHQLGEISKTEFKKIWRSDIYQDFRKKLMANRQAIDICKNCSEGSKVWV
jgi:radical SAM protein with 4Fe4S-binding SPASM domain